MKSKRVSVSEDFSPHPGARYRVNGELSGEEFREEFLEPLIADNRIERIEVDLDGVDGYATSFLEEAFGGLVRKYGYDQVAKRIRIISDEDSSLIPLIDEYMKDAHQKSKGSQRR